MATHRLTTPTHYDRFGDHQIEFRECVMVESMRVNLLQTRATNVFMRIHVQKNYVT